MSAIDEQILGGRRLATAINVDERERRFQQAQASVHQELVAALELSKLSAGHPERVRSHVRRMAEHVCKNRSAALQDIDQGRLVDSVLNETFGLGPLEPLLADPEISDILVNGPETVYIERRGKLELTKIIFADEAHLLRTIQRIVSRLGRRIDEASPLVDARLPDGSRVHAAIRPLALDGPVLSIRRFGVDPFRMPNLLDLGSIVPDMATFLEAAVRSRLGMIISGGTGAGKTTMLNALSEYIPDGERLVTIEDSAELVLRHRHRVRLECRPANADGVGEVSARELVRNSLRMRPDRIIVGEVRGPEVWDMLQAMNTGHEGSLTTIHANSAGDALTRLEMMVAMTGFELPIPVVRQYLISGVRILVHLSRLAGGRRRVMQVTELSGIENGEIVRHDIFRFEQTGVDANNDAVGEFRATGYQPECLERMKAAGISLPQGLFATRKLTGTTERTGR
ncbi:MAG: CpaF family protein [Planctomycetes bacterium]|nr:CpaF family protein [Planctomycetota bacterium]